MSIGPGRPGEIESPGQPILDSGKEVKNISRVAEIGECGDAGPPRSPHQDTHIRECIGDFAANDPDAW